MIIKVLKKAANVLLSIRITLMIFNIILDYNVLEVSAFGFNLFFFVIAVLFHVIAIYSVNKEVDPEMIRCLSVLFTLGLIPAFRYGLIPSENVTTDFCSSDILAKRSMCSILTTQFYTIIVFVVSHVVLVLVLWGLYIKLRNGVETRPEGVVHQQQVCVAQPAPVAGMIYQQQGVPVYHSA